jgi:hypothetical protein
VKISFVDVRNPASLLNHDNLTDDEAIVCTSPFVPVYVNPCVRDGRYREDENVDDAAAALILQRYLDKVGPKTFVEEIEDDEETIEEKLV